jgi:hypothetical protein
MAALAEDWDLDEERTRPTDWLWAVLATVVVLALMSGAISYTVLELFDPSRGASCECEEPAED